MKFFGSLLLSLCPAVALAAGGAGVADGFGAQDWLDRWPVLAIVFGTVCVSTGMITVQIVKRARKTRQRT